MNLIEFGIQFKDLESFDKVRVYIVRNFNIFVREDFSNVVINSLLSQSNFEQTLPIILENEGVIIYTRTWLPLSNRPINNIKLNQSTGLFDIRSHCSKVLPGYYDYVKKIWFEKNTDISGFFYKPEYVQILNIQDKYYSIVIHNYSYSVMPPFS